MKRKSTTTRIVNKDKMTGALHALVLSSLLLSPFAGASGFQSHASILEAARGYLETQAAQQHAGRVEVNLRRLDSRLNLQPCGADLHVELAPGAQLKGATSVRVSCLKGANWSLYVTGKIAVFGKTLITRRSLSRNEQLGRDDVQVVERDLSDLHYGYLDSPEQAVGMQMTRALPAGQILTPQLVKAPKVIERGDRVTLMAESGGITVRMRGEALADGAQGERLRVRALNSKRIVEGLVLSAGVVKVTL
jgi:flagella basal body P-ring formation protein FlgA